MAKIQLSQRMYSISDVARLLKSGEMQIQPKYQRRRTAWPLSAKTALIDTILSNFPILPIYLRDYKDPSGKRRKEIIDGQQRISTIREYYNDEFRLSRTISDRSLGNCLCSELPSDQFMTFEDYELPFVSIRGANEADVVSIFTRHLRRTDVQTTQFLDDRFDSACRYPLDVHFGYSHHQCSF